VLRRYRDRDEEQANQRSAGTGAGDKEVDELWWNHGVRPFSKELLFVKKCSF
jgi:hypothetical protein